MDVRLVVLLCLASGAVPLPAESHWRALLVSADRLKSQGRLADAERTYWSAVDDAGLLAPDSAPAATAYHELAGFYQDTGRCDAAAQAYGRSVALWKETGARGESYLFRTSNHLIGLDLECGDVAAAERRHRALIAPRLATRSGHDPDADVAHALTNLGSIDFHRGRYSAARAHYEAALAMRERLPATPPAEMAVLLSNLARALLRAGDADRALAVSRRAVEVVEADAATPTPFLAAVFVNAAETAAAARRWPEAESLLSRALTLSRGPSGQDQPLTATVMSRYAALLKAQRRKREATVVEAQAREIRLQFPGAATRQTINVRELSILK